MVWPSSLSTQQDYVTTRIESKRRAYAGRERDRDRGGLSGARGDPVSSLRSGGASFGCRAAGKFADYFLGYHDVGVSRLGFAATDDRRVFDSRVVQFCDRPLCLCFREGDE